MHDPKVTKEYLEDLGEQDAEGFYDYAYRYWAYSFDFGDRQYGVRVYPDEPRVAFVNGPTRWSEAPTDPYLRAIGRQSKPVPARSRCESLARAGDTTVLCSNSADSYSPR